jgi:hypothetical protein
MKKIAIATPLGSDSGGPEALHQLCNALIRSGRDAYIYPFAGSENNKPVERFSHYGCPIDNSLNKDTVLVVPEIVPHLIMRSGQTILWWLSIDNSPLVKKPEIAIENDINTTNVLSTEEFWVRFHSPNVTHLAQSYYAKNYLKDKYLIKSQMLTDYIPLDEYKEKKTQNKELVTFSLKGSQFYDYYADKLSDHECLRLAGMSRNEVLQHLSNSRLYIDLGNQPGRDRLPREASLLHTYVMVNKKGAGSFYRDSPLSQEFKINVADPYTSLKKIDAILKRKPSPNPSQIFYREWIKKQKIVFELEVRKLLKLL